AVAGPVKPLNVTLSCSVCAAGSNTSVTEPVPGDAFGGTSFAAERVVANVIVAACAAGTDSISALLKPIAKTTTRDFMASSQKSPHPPILFLDCIERGKRPTTR